MQRPSAVAGWGARLAAVTVDACVLAAIALLLLIGLLHAGAGGDAAVRDSRELVAAVAGDPVLRAVPLLALLLMAVGRLLSGRTLGQWLVGIRIVRAEDGRAAGAARVLLRGAVLLLLLLPAGLGLLLARLDPGRRAPHDRLARTLAVEEDESALPLERLETML